MVTVFLLSCTGHSFFLHLIHSCLSLICRQYVKPWTYKDYTQHTLEKLSPAFVVSSVKNISSHLLVLILVSYECSFQKRSFYITHFVRHSLTPSLPPSCYVCPGFDVLQSIAAEYLLGQIFDKKWVRSRRCMICFL